MKVMITGADGQVGLGLLRTAPSTMVVHACTRNELDIGDPARVKAVIGDARPDVVINTAAYTAVDRAETERDIAFAVNATGVSALAQSCLAVDARLVHISTDYVFDGQSVAAYETNTRTQPINVYGTSKLAGERHLAATANLNWTLVRTSWVYAPWGRNFVLTMLRLMRERAEVSVVCDQIGAPTSAISLARFLWHIASHPEVRGILHYVDAGVASWYDFAVAINEEAVAAGLLQRPSVVKPISTSEFPTPAKRPALSLLATRASLQAAPCAQPHWREALREALNEIRSLQT